MPDYSKLWCVLATSYSHIYSSVHQGWYQVDTRREDSWQGVPKQCSWEGNPKNTIAPGRQPSTPLISITRERPNAHPPAATSGSTYLPHVIERMLLLRKCLYKGPYWTIKALFWSCTEQATKSTRKQSVTSLLAPDSFPSCVRSTGMKLQIISM